MLRRGSWKYNHWANDIAELYDLSSDPEEKVNLALDPAHQARIDAMRRELLAFNRLA
jgi:choline-sulfatase